MKKISKIAKKTLLLIVSIFILLATINVGAVAQTIELGTGEQLPKYIGTTKFSTKITKSGTLLYCLNIHKNTAKNTTAKLVGERDAGVAYIIVNGYPNKTFTGDKSKDYYITQTALWWYLDNTTGSSNLSKEFKTTASDPNNLRPTIKNLVAGAEEAKKKGYQKPTFSLTTEAKDMKLENNYYITEEIYAQTATNISSYNVTVEGVTNAQIIDAAGNVKTTFNPGEKFRVKVPVSALKSTETEITLTATATGTLYKAYEYQPIDPALQPITPCIPEKETATITSKLNFNISSSKVSIVKIDSTTKQALAGATLVLKDSEGKVVTTWESTTNYHVIRNLKDGKYTVEETKAPQGYLLNTTPLTFEVSSNNRELKLNFENTPRQSVVNIIKIDKETGSPLAGATLVVKDSTGAIVASFTSTLSPYVLTDLKNGTYTVEEITAPVGYKKSDEIKSFTISDESLSHQITFENYPEVPVPDTEASSLIIIILGIILSAAGIGYAYKYGKKTR